MQNSLGAVIASYTYDAVGRRITTTESGTTTNNYFDGQNLVMQQTSGGTVTNQFVWGSFYVNQLVQETNPSGTFYVQQDANWNVSSISSSSGSIVERDQYDPYGGIIVLSSGGTTIGAGISSSTVGQIFGFQGGWTDPITGLVHFQMRDLNTGLGVWIEQDPDHAINGPDTYQLTLSNPIANDDPTGMWSLNRWLYTGDGNASDEVYNAATDAGGDAYIDNAGTAHQGLQLLSKVKGVGVVAAKTDAALADFEGNDLNKLLATGNGTAALQAELAFAQETSAKSLERLKSQKLSSRPWAAVTAPTPRLQLSPPGGADGLDDSQTILKILQSVLSDDDSGDDGDRDDDHNNSADQPPPEVQQQIDQQLEDEGDSTDQSNSGADSNSKVVIIDGSQYPESAQHAQEAIDNGVAPSGVVDRDGNSDRRSDRMQGVSPVTGKDRDEFPPAVIANDDGYSVKPISSSDNRGSGAAIGNQLRGVPNGTPVVVQPINVPGR